MRWAVVFALLGGPVAAQDLDCAAPVAQADMNECSYVEAVAADEALNAAYADAIAVARAMAEYSDVDVEEALRAAQRAWIDFRDLACDVESLQAEGGSMQPMLYTDCIARVTWARVDDLTIFADLEE